MGKYFGTDGIRSKAGDFPLDVETVTAIGMSLAKRLAEEKGRPATLITGRDTRESGLWIEQALHRGIILENGTAVSAGVITTPGVAYLTRSEGADAGIVVSASHNPFEDNGIKVFTPSGKKIDEALELAIESDIGSARTHSGPLGNVGTPDDVAEGPEAAGLRSKYLAHLAEEFKELDLTDIRIVADCANGSASALAPKLFEELGAEVISLNTAPDGRNINLNCGSLHLEGLQKAVISNAAHLGVAFDGDADRSLFVDEKGGVVDGDALLFVMAKYFLSHGQLANKKVVATVMSNIGLEIGLKKLGVDLVRTSVGDKYVLDELLRSGSEIGGEQSGHIIFPARSIVGDGMLTTLYFLTALRSANITPSESIAGFVRFPQTLVNVRVSRKDDFQTVPAIVSAAQRIENELDGKGRLLLRYSGTENLARVMIEGPDEGMINQQAAHLAQVIAAELG